MVKNTKVFDHPSVLNGIVYELETIIVNIDDLDKDFRLVLSLPSLYEHIIPIIKHNVDYNY